MFNRDVGESLPEPCWGPQQVCCTQFPDGFFGQSRTQSLFPSTSPFLILYCLFHCFGITIIVPFRIIPLIGVMIQNKETITAMRSNNRQDRLSSGKRMIHGTVSIQKFTSVNEDDRPDIGIRPRSQEKSVRREEGQRIRLKISQGLSFKRGLNLMTRLKSSQVESR